MRYTKNCAIFLAHPLFVKQTVGYSKLFCKCCAFYFTQV